MLQDGRCITHGTHDYCKRHGRDAIPYRKRTSHDPILRLVVVGNVCATSVPLENCTATMSR